MGLKNAITSNFQHKVFALLAAILIWAVVNKSITSTRVFTRVPIRVVNVPTDKTIRGLMPNNILDRRITLTLTGTRDVIDRLETQDFEVVIDAADKNDDWIVHVGKKNLVSLNPDIDLMRNVSQVSHGELIVQICPLITEKIPVFILPPRGDSPDGYQFLDVWPHKLTHIVSGPEDDVRKLQEKGIELVFDLSNITKADLDQLRIDEGSDSDEVSYFVPDAWKKVQIPFLNNLKQEINGPEARHLRIDFLRKELLPLDRSIPVRVFYPLSSIADVNQKTLPLSLGGLLEMQNEEFLLSGTFYSSDVSRLFLDIVRDRLEIVIIAPEVIRDNETLSWDVDFVDPHQLEDLYVAKLMSTEHTQDTTSAQSQVLQKHQTERELYFRNLFREYMQRFVVYAGKDAPLNLNPKITSGKIVVEEATH